MTMHAIRSVLALFLCLGLNACGLWPFDSAANTTAVSTAEIANESASLGDAQQYKTSQAVSNTDALADFNQANQLLANDPQQAERLYLQAIDEVDDFEAAYFNLLKLQFEQQNKAQLNQYYQQVRTKQIASARIENLMAVYYRQQSDFDKAKTHYQRALAIDETHLASLKNIGILYELYLQQPAQALDYYQRYQQALALIEQQDKQIDNWITDLQSQLQQN
jgi:tetratricopeptide (TPR) repeat protein